MAKIKLDRKIQKYRTEDEMRQALTDLCTPLTLQARILQDDDPDIVMNDVVEELLESRALLAEVRNALTIITPKLNVRR